MHLTVPELGVVLLLLFGLFHWLNVLVKTRSVMAIFGVVAVGLTGVVGHLAAALVGWVLHAAGSITAWAFGVSASVVLAIVLGALLIHDWHPKKGAKPRTGFVALAVGILLVAGVSQLPFLAPVVSGMRSLLGDVVNSINSLH
jgi:hypothetical protein